MSVMYHFSLPDLRCVMCVAPIENELSQHQERLNIQAFQVDPDEKTLTVVMKDDKRLATDFIDSVVDLLDGIGVLCQKESSVKQWSRRHWFWSALGLGAGVLVLILSLVMSSLPFAVMVAMASFSIPLTLLLGVESYKNFSKARALNMDTLFSLSTLTVLMVSTAAFVFPGLPMMFDVGLLIFGFRHLGLAIEESLKRAIGSKTTFKSRLPTVVQRDSDGEVFLNDIKVGDRLIINPGDMIPVDGRSDKAALIVQVDFTGNTDPYMLEAGAPILSGMVFKGQDPICLTATATAENSSLAKLDQGIALALQEKAPLETATKQILKYFIPVILGLAFLSGAAVGYFFLPALGIQCAVAVLVSACPCTLGLITPLAIKIGMKKAAEHGVLFKSAKKLEEAAGIDTVLFDLNGTLTSNKPAVRGYYFSPNEITKEEFFVLANSLETEAPHSVAQVICDFIRRQDVPVPKDQRNLVRGAFCRNGVSAVIDGVSYQMGNQDMMGMLDTPMPSSLIVGDSLIYLARAGKIIGYFIINDPLRHESVDLVEFLKATGKQVYICTGSDGETVRRYASALGIESDHILYSRAPAESVAQEQQEGNKQADIKALQARGHRVAMVGDAGNDAVAVAASDFGIAVLSKSMADMVTQDKAGAVIQDDTLWSVVTALTVAEQTVANIKQNLLFSLLYNVGAMLLASGLLLTLGVVLNPSIGVALMILQSSILLLNAYFFKQKQLPDSPALEPERSVIQNGLESSYRQVLQQMPSRHLDASEEPRRLNSAANLVVDNPTSVVGHVLPESGSKSSIVPQLN